MENLRLKRKILKHHYRNKIIFHNKLFIHIIQIFNHIIQTYHEVNEMETRNIFLSHPHSTHGKIFSSSFFYSPKENRQQMDTPKPKPQINREMDSSHYFMPFQHPTLFLFFKEFKIHFTNSLRHGSYISPINILVLEPSNGQGVCHVSQSNKYNNQLGPIIYQLCEFN